jgi:hypothetical protein
MFHVKQVRGRYASAMAVELMDILHCNGDGMQGISVLRTIEGLL